MTNGKCPVAGAHVPRGFAERLNADSSLTSRLDHSDADTDDGEVAYELASGLEHISTHSALDHCSALAESPGYVKLRAPLQSRLKNRR